MQPYHHIFKHNVPVSVWTQHCVKSQFTFKKVGFVGCLRVDRCIDVAGQIFPQGFNGSRSVISRRFWDGPHVMTPESKRLVKRPWEEKHKDMSDRLRRWTDQRSAVLLPSMTASSPAAQGSGGGSLWAAEAFSTGFPARADISFGLLLVTQKHDGMLLPYRACMPRMSSGCSLKPRRYPVNTGPMSALWNWEWPSPRAWPISWAATIRRFAP